MHYSRTYDPTIKEVQYSEPLTNELTDVSSYVSVIVKLTVDINALYSFYIVFKLIYQIIYLQSVCYILHHTHQYTSLFLSHKLRLRC